MNEADLDKKDPLPECWGMSGRKEPPDDFLLSLGLIGVSDSNSGLEDRRRSIMDSLMDLGNSFDLVLLLLVLGEDTTELFGDMDA